ncbi:MAG: hypothetical protein FWD69_01695 [Polyangiaceae bacterium]|nr:hypothetical protein [Polyangiaceae bacterium]
MAVDPDRLERLMEQVLSEVGDFRQTVSCELKELKCELKELECELKELKCELKELKRDVKLTQRAVLDVSDDVKHIKAKIDNHATRLDKIEGAA